MIIVNLHTPSISCDNAAALEVVENGGISKRSKHIDNHYSLGKVHDGLINVKYAPRDDQNFADLFTKPVAKVAFQMLIPLDKDYAFQFYNNEALGVVLFYAFL